MESNFSHIKPSLEDQFLHYKVCILLPTYNNGNTIQDVILKSLQLTSHVLVVNDGSTDDTLDLISQYPIQLVSYVHNKGKGYGLRAGFQYALLNGYDYVIALDTDGQHFPEDCRLLLETLSSNEGSLIIGARNLHHENVPGKSSFGNKFSNFWFYIETGFKLPDTQSGFRLYPVFKYKDMIFYTRKYEFEIEIIVRSSWKGINILSVPIQVYYPKQQDRITHFRPFKDFTRISILNTVLVFISFLYIKPRDLLIKPLKKKGILKGLKELLFSPSESTFTRAASVGFGVFMGIVPIWGFQLLVGIPLAIYMKLNKTLFILAANISLFPPIIWAASLATGKLVYQNPHWKIDFHNLQWKEVAQTGKEFFVGGTLLSIIAGALAFLLSYSILSIRAKNKISKLN